MITYFDTSALLPLLLDEVGSTTAREVWTEAERTACATIAYAEARAALARAVRVGRLAASDLQGAVDELESIYDQLGRIDVDESLVRRAGQLAHDHFLRGYDAVHLAAVESINDDQTVLVAGDGDLLEAAQAIGVAVLNVAR